MLISIIIPTYNRAHLIKQTLDSLVSQTYKNWECIVVDDSSTANSEKIVNQYIAVDKRFKFYKRPIDKPKGANSCRNYGFQKSKGTYVKWFDSDDVMLPDLLEKQLQSFLDFTDVSVCRLQYFDFHKNIVLKENVIFSDNLLEDYFTGKVSFYVSGPLWKRCFLEKQVQLFDETISNLDDWEFNLRMLYQKINIVYLDESLIKYRIHSESLSHEINKLNFVEIKSEFKAREKHIMLLKGNKVTNFKILMKFIEKRYKFILREALIQKHNKSFYLFYKLLVIQLKNLLIPRNHS